MDKILVSLLMGCHFNAIAQIPLLGPDNSKLFEMTNREFQEIFTEQKIKKGLTAEEVVKLLGNPTEVAVDRVTGKFTWIYDSSRINLIIRSFEKLDRFRFAVIIFNQDETVDNFKFHIR